MKNGLPPQLEMMAEQSARDHGKVGHFFSALIEQNERRIRLAEHVDPLCECGCAFEAHISALHVMIPCVTCGPCKEWRPVAA